MKQITISSNNTPWLSDGFDWGLPDNTIKSEKGGMFYQYGGTDAAVSGTFIELDWKDIEPNKGQFEFDDFEAALAQAGENVLIRLNVNSVCNAPNWTLDANSDDYIPSLNNKSFQFWKSEYIIQLAPLITEFANNFKNEQKIKGVHLGVADGEFYKKDLAGNLVIPLEGDCSGQQDGWGEFWVNATEHAASESAGLTPANFESSVKAIIDIYSNAFSGFTHKLAFTSFGNFSTEASDTSYRDRMQSIVDYSMGKGIGNRTGQPDDWMRYMSHRYGVDLKSKNSNDQGCYLTFDENFADSIDGRYWGDENEMYGLPHDPSNDWITNYGGPRENQPYRFHVSALRDLQLRKNYVSGSKAGYEYLRGLNNEYNTADFITYLSKTLGRTRADTPDAFVLLGERTSNTSINFPHEDYDVSNNSDEVCLRGAAARGYVKIREFGRWLSEVSNSTPDLFDDDDQILWGNNSWGVQSEYKARKSPEMLFDINDQLMQERCPNGCNLEVKVVFKDDSVRTLQVVQASGIGGEITSLGGGQTRTATFPISGQFNNGLNGADFSVKTTDGSDLSVLMARVNIVNSPKTVYEDGEDGNTIKRQLTCPVGDN